MMRRVVLSVVLVIGMLGPSACARGVKPAELDTANTACRYCRMAASDVHFAAQIVAPGVEPVFFDDIGCLANYLKQPRGQPPAEAVVFVADHRTGAWVRASLAVFTRTDKVSTPMNGGIIAHASEESKAQDPASAGGTAVVASEIFGPSGLPGGGRS